MNREKLLAAAEALEDLVVAYATGGGAEEESYRPHRDLLLAEDALASLIPAFLRQCHNLDQFWAFIKSKFGTYAERREYLWGEMRPLLEFLEHGGKADVDKPIDEVLQDFHPDTVQSLWHKALARRDRDPEGAITAARSLLEAVCKHVLHEAGQPCGESWDLPRLYRATAESLNLAPSQHSEDAFKRILGGCTSVVEGLGTLRNRLSDSHGPGPATVRPAPRHALLSVNLAGAMSLYIVQTWRARSRDNADA